MKLINKEKIIEKVKKLYDIVKLPCNRRRYGFCMGFCAAIEDVIKILDSTPEDSISEDLHQASIAYADANSEYVTNKNGELVEHYNIRAKEYFIAGAQWQKQQIMKDAKVYPLIEDPSGYMFFDLRMAYPTEKCRPGSKVKLIIIKED